MWDDPQALRRVTNGLVGFSLLLALLILLNYALRLPAFALRAVQLDSPPRRIDHAQLERAVRTSLRGNFFTVDLDQARQAFERLPWVRTVSVRRHFPWQLDVSLEEHEALARWNGGELVNVEGEVFAAKDPDALPEFAGPEDSAAEMARRYARFSEMLSPLGFRIAQLTLSQRHAWQVRLEGGMVLDLGRENMEERLARFVAAYPQYAGKLKSTAKYVDLRYRDGLAVGIAG